VEGKLLLYIVVRKGSAILKLLTSKNQMLLVVRDAFFIVDSGLHNVDHVRQCSQWRNAGISHQELSEVSA